MPESENFIEQIGPYVISEIEYRTISIIFENRKTQQKKKIQRVVRRILRKNPAQKLNLIQQMIAPDEKRKGRV